MIQQKRATSRYFEAQTVVASSAHPYPEPGSISCRAIITYTSLQKSRQSAVWYSRVSVVTILSTTSIDGCVYIAQYNEHNNAYVYALYAAARDNDTTRYTAPTHTPCSPCPAMPAKPIEASKRRKIRVVPGRAVHVPHQRFHPVFNRRGPPARPEHRHDGRRIYDVRVVEVLCVSCIIHHTAARTSNEVDARRRGHARGLG